VFFDGIGRGGSKIPLTNIAFLQFLFATKFVLTSPPSPWLEGLIQKFFVPYSFPQKRLHQQQQGHDLLDNQVKGITY